MSDRGPEDFLPLSAAQLHILLTLADGPCHGYAIKRQVEERTDGKVRLAAGSLYEGIQRLAKQGVLEETEAPADGETPPSSRWRFYGMTALGDEVLSAELVRLEGDLAWARAHVANGARSK